MFLFPFHKTFILGDQSHKRRKRDTLPLTKLISPDTKLDLPKSFDNFGNVAKTIFEDEKAPMFHVRNLVGSTQDTIMSAMRVPPKNILVPTKLSIMKDEEIEMNNPQGNQNNVGAINPKIMTRMGGTDKSTNNKEDGRSAEVEDDIDASDNSDNDFGEFLNSLVSLI